MYKSEGAPVLILCCCSTFLVSSKTNKSKSWETVRRRCLRLNLKKSRKILFYFYVFWCGWWGAALLDVTIVCYPKSDKSEEEDGVLSLFLSRLSVRSLLLSSKTTSVFVWDGAQKRKKLKRHKSFSMSGQVFFLGCCCSVINHHMLYCRRCTHTSSSSSSSWLYAEKWRLGIGGFYLNISFSLSHSLTHSLTHSHVCFSLSLHSEALTCLDSSTFWTPAKTTTTTFCVCV